MIVRVPTKVSGTAKLDFPFWLLQQTRGKSESVAWEMAVRLGRPGPQRRGFVASRPTDRPNRRPQLAGVECKGSDWESAACPIWSPYSRFRAGRSEYRMVYGVDAPLRYPGTCGWSSSVFRRSGNG